MIEITSQFGFDGVYGSEAWTPSFIKDRVPLENLANRLFMAYALDASDPDYSTRAHNFYKAYVNKYGKEEWSVFAAISYAAMTTFEPGINAASAPTGEAIRKAMFASKTLEHPLFGTSTWSGKDIFGADTHLLTPLPIYSMDKNGAFHVTKVVDVKDWWQKNKAASLPALKAGGQVYTKN